MLGAFDHHENTMLPRAFQLTLCTLLLLVLQACGGGGGGTATPGAVDPAGGSSTILSINSSRSGYGYLLQVYVPASYAGGSARYPVIYATDGDAAYPPEGRFANFQRIMERRGTQAILVGIGGTARRGTDYALPGARDYHAFLVQELIPLIESRYRADPKRRILSGLSLGGSFVATVLFIEAPGTLNFSHYLSSEGAFWQQDVLDLEQQLSDSIGNKSIPAMLLLARSDFQGTNGVVVNALYRKMAARGYNGLQLLETSFQANHVGMDNPSFEDAVSRILP